MKKILFLILCLPVLSFGQVAKHTSSGVNTFLDDRYVNVPGDTMTGTLTGTQINLSGQETVAGSMTVTGAMEGATLNTGEGANELYDMNQNVETTNNVTFNTGIFTATATVQGSAFSVGGSTLVVKEGNVGIGTTEPIDKLNIVGNFRKSDPISIAHGITQYGLNTDVIFRIQNYGGTEGGGLFSSLSDDANTPGFVIIGVIGVTDPTDTVPAILLTGGKKDGANVGVLGNTETILQIRNGNLAGTNLLTILGGGNVGIGKTAPANTLHIVGPNDTTANTPQTYTPLVVDNSQNSGISIQSGNSYVGTIEFGDASADTQGRIRYNHTADDMQFFSSGTVRMAISGTGLVGIGTVAPATKLHLSSGVITNDGTGSIPLSYAVCFTTAGAMGHCNTAVAADGGCGCITP